MPTKKEAASAQKTILVVEDDQELLQAYQLMLEHTGAHVVAARDGEEALAALQSDPPNVLLLDLLLPGMNGFDVLATMRKNEKWKNVPVIVLSNLKQAQDVERGRGLGVKYYIVKADTKIGEIVEKIKEFL